MSLNTHSLIEQCYANTRTLSPPPKTPLLPQLDLSLKTKTPDNIKEVKTSKIWVKRIERTTMMTITLIL
jgi:hypothetical protein